MKVSAGIECSVISVPLRILLYIYNKSFVNRIFHEIPVFAINNYSVIFTVLILPLISSLCPDLDFSPLLKMQISQSNGANPTIKVNIF